ncbi:MAG: DUF5050 domain-containing protein [Oscillospiraceae bacterium]|nr:DUF5050 domain-containing protein [Oscillospiraceae bacterium]MCL2158967.1 DUF5050 domain-containing protein [Oscillospiraceae bacterium]
MKKIFLCIIFSFIFFLSCVKPTEEEKNVYFNIDILNPLEQDSYRYTYDKECGKIYFVDKNAKIYEINENGNNKELIFSAEKYDHVYIDNIYYYDHFIYFVDQKSKIKGFYKIDLNNGELLKIEIDEEFFDFAYIDQYMIYDNEIYISKTYWEGLWKINLENLELIYYGNLRGNFCFDTEYLYVQSGQKIYKIAKEPKDDNVETIDTAFIVKDGLQIGNIYLSNEKIFYSAYNWTNDTDATDANPYRYYLYCSNRDGTEPKKINTDVLFGGVLFEKSGYIYFIEKNSGHLYRFSSTDETIEQVCDLDMKYYDHRVIGDYLYIDEIDEKRENIGFNVMRIHIDNGKDKFAIEKINWLDN